MESFPSINTVRLDYFCILSMEYDGCMADIDIPYEYYGWWRIIETSRWVNGDIDIIGPALISLTGYDDRLRMFVLLAYVLTPRINDPEYPAIADPDIPRPSYPAQK